MERKLEEEEMKEDQGGGCDDDGDEDTDDDEWMNADEGGGHKDTDEDFSVEKNVSIGRTSGPGQKCVPGIIYLGHIPPRLRPRHLRNMLSSYGEVGRVFLQPEDQQVRRRKKRSGLRRCDFTEGWVEFRDKRVAKKVAASLHNTPMGTKKRQKFYSDLWSIKYLHKFQWTHLSERLAYEQTVLQQRLRTEVSQAKRETSFYLSNVDKSAHLEKLRKRRKQEGQQVEERTWDFSQRQTEEEIQTRKRRKSCRSQKQLEKSGQLQQQSHSNTSLLAKIFRASTAD
ncbi:activator of basal transcription 1 [Takifugu rubripes]|uniref:Activator of basal transcription 1 n=1 Tax=Takifugu rubripes TaxID=31033 RepID=H2RYR3_TAKRU|nr:activator of basal transcription 1 [Takifugu rubripes]